MSIDLFISAQKIAFFLFVISLENVCANSIPNRTIKREEKGKTSKKTLIIIILP